MSRRDLWVGVCLCLHSPIHTAPSRALASVVPSLERTGGLCARAGGGGVRPGPEVFPTTLVRPEEALGGGRNGVGAQDPGEPGCFVSIGGSPVGFCRAEEEQGERTIFDFMPPKRDTPLTRATRSGGPPGPAAPPAKRTAATKRRTNTTAPVRTECGAGCRAYTYDRGAG